MTATTYGPLNPRPTTAPEYRAKADIARRAGDLTQAARYSRKARTAPETVETDRSVADDRAETDPCQRSTPGCCIDHGSDAGPCETW